MKILNKTQNNVKPNLNVKPQYFEVTQPTTNTKPMLGKIE